MEIAIKIFLFLHLIGMASLLGGSLAQVKEKTHKVTRIMKDGALTQLVTGFILVGLVQANDEDLQMVVAGLKIALLVIILLLIYKGQKKLSKNSYLAILFLSMVNVALALVVAS